MQQNFPLRCVSFPREIIQLSWAHHLAQPLAYTSYPPTLPPVDRITLKLGNKHNHNHELKYQSNDIKLPIITTCTHGIRNLRSCVYPAPQHTNTYTNKEVITSISMRKKPGKQMLTLFEKLKSFTAININPKSDMIKKYENIFVSLV